MVSLRTCNVNVKKKVKQTNHTHPIFWKTNQSQ